MPALPAIIPISCLLVQGGTSPERPCSKLSPKSNRPERVCERLAAALLGLDPTVVSPGAIWIIEVESGIHVEQKSLCIHSQLKSPSSSEVASMIEGVIRHCTEMEVDRQYVDSHGRARSPSRSAVSWVSSYSRG